MSDSHDRPQSGKEGKKSAIPTDSPSGQIQYDPFRPSPWTSASFGQRSGRFPPRGSFAGSDPAQPRPPPDMGSHQPSIPDDHSRYPQSLTSPPESAYSPPLPPTYQYGSASDRSSASEYPSENVRATGSSGRSFLAPWAEGSVASETTAGTQRQPHRGPRFNRRDEFDGPTYILQLPSSEQEQIRGQALLQLPSHLSFEEQDEVIRRANDVLSQCAFHFVAKYSFPIPVEPDKPVVVRHSDRDWTEWAYLIKRLATKRRIPKEYLYGSQIKQLVTTLENSIVVRQPVGTSGGPPIPRQPRDDRYMLQLVSSGLQVAKILMDSLAMQQLNQLYIQTEGLILERRSLSGSNRTRVEVTRGARNIHDRGDVDRGRRPGDGGGLGMSGRGRGGGGGAIGY